MAIVFFGKLDDWEAALEKFESEKVDLYAGRVPRRRLSTTTKEESRRIVAPIPGTVMTRFVRVSSRRSVVTVS
jgi:hypothetical protein